MSEPKKADHQVNIVRLGEPRVHTNADTLELFDIAGYQCVTKKGNFKAGELAVYIQPDSVVPQTEPFRFIWEPWLSKLSDPNVPEKRRRITVRRFRKEVSEGLLMPLSDFVVGQGKWIASAAEGTDVSEFIGVTHYEGDQDVESTEGITHNPVRKYPKTIKGWFFWTLYKLGFKGARRQMNMELSFDVPKFDVENFKNFKNTIQDGEEVIVTEKIHGSQARYVYKEGVMYAGSRNYWKASDSPCVWRKALVQNPWIKGWCQAHEGQPLYGEVVPTQKGYSYGCKQGEVKFFAFDARNADGDYYTKAEFLHGLTSEYGDRDFIIRVPILYEGSFNRESIAILVDGVSAVDDRTQREGIVITVKDPARTQRGIGRIQLKWKSSAFLEKDGNR